MKEKILTAVEEVGQILKIVVSIGIFVHFFSPGGIGNLRTDLSTASLGWWIAASFGLGIATGIVRSIYKAIKHGFLKVPEKA